MKLKKCKKCKTYTINNVCNKCYKEAKDAHYKFVKIKDAPKSTAEHFNKRRGLQSLKNA